MLLPEIILFIIFVLSDFILQQIKLNLCNKLAKLFLLLIIFPYYKYIINE